MTDPTVFCSGPVMDKLTEFQRNTVNHVYERFYGDNPTDRFLIADETGLGKTIIARGLIARAIEKLQHEDGIDHIDIVYVCSNMDLAQQNLRKLDVLGGEQHGIASRLTLLSKHRHRFSGTGANAAAKPVNLVSFTPETSFGRSHSSGKVQERAMLYLLLELPLGLTGLRAESAERILQGNVQSPERFRREVEDLRQTLDYEIDPDTSAAFLEAAAAVHPRSLLREFEELIEGFTEESRDENFGAYMDLVGRMRRLLARVSIDVLTPDLVILDEFQRFRDLLDEGTEAGELAHNLFEYRYKGSGHRAKVLLLSATPFKGFAYAEEAADGDDHHKDFMTIVEWLSNGDGALTNQISHSLKDYRRAAVAGEVRPEVIGRARASLLQVMTRNERPHSWGRDGEPEGTTTTEHNSELAPPPASELLGFVSMKRLAAAVEAPFSIEYWKSAPYFVNFMGGYKIDTSIGEALQDPRQRGLVRSLLGETQRIRFAEVRAYRQIPPGNTRLRALTDQTIGQGWWRLLWVPPTLPYLAPGGPYADASSSGMTKRVIFSSWKATPAAVASLLSYEAERRCAGEGFLGTTPEERQLLEANVRRRLSYRLDREGERDRPSSMSTLALFWPMPGLAEIGDPGDSSLHRGRPVGSLDADTQHSVVVGRISEQHEESGDDASGVPASHWFEALRRDDSCPCGLGETEILHALRGGDDSEKGDAYGEEPLERHDRMEKHVQLALEVRGKHQDRRVTAAVLDRMADVAAHSPGNIAYRALSRIAWRHPGVTEKGLWLAAARLSSAFRTLFSRPETGLLLDQLIPDNVPYWRKVLQYCAWGNLQAVMDEYVHHLHVSQGTPQLDDSELCNTAEMAATALELRSASYQLFDPDRPDETPRLPGRFALWFGGRRHDKESARQPIVRGAFNSPFWPFVLSTTSVGQEGVDFHWWSHAVFHWNTPANPIDFEQREGRVDRYAGHAIRKNIVARHGEAILASEEPNPWRVAYELATDEMDNYGAFAPHWVYPGDATVERHVAPYPLSLDSARLADVKRSVAYYRLTFGQPRQEDMLELLRQMGSKVRVDELRLDLSAPPR